MNPSQQPQPKRRRRRRIVWTVRLVLIVFFTASAGWWYHARYITTNFHEVVPGQVYRSAQPDPEVLAGWMPRYGLRSVINLRGEGKQEIYNRENQVVTENGGKWINLRMAAWREPDAPTMHKLVEILETAPRPMLLHCHHGVDRTGIASVLAAMAIGGEDYQKASGQISLKTLHLLPRNGITLLLDRYENYCQVQGQPTGGWKEFRHWLMTSYAPREFNIKIAAPDQVSAQVGRFTSVQLTVTNRSDKPIVFSDNDKEFRITTTLGTPDIMESWGKSTGPVTYLKWLDLPVGDSRTVRHRLPAMAKPGRYKLRFDIVRAGQPRDTSFGREGARLATCELVVSETTD